MYKNGIQKSLFSDSVKNLEINQKKVKNQIVYSPAINYFCVLKQQHNEHNKKDTIGLDFRV